MVRISLMKQRVPFILINFIICLTLLSFLDLSEAMGAELFSKNDSPFNSSKDIWLSKWWSWSISIPNDNRQCVMNQSGPMVMLMDTALKIPSHQECKISSNQGIMIPMWTSFMESSTPEFENYSYDELTKYAREQFDLGAITSLVSVDGIPVAKMDVVSDLSSGVLNYKINRMENVSEIYSKGFNITIPDDTRYPDQNAGIWRSGAHGWFVFLKPLPIGNHQVFYQVGITGLGPNNFASEITYSLKVE